MQAKPGEPVPGAVQRLRLACVCAGVTLLVFSQSSGKEAADTKLDLVVAPGRFLAAALRMWDPQSGAGQMQDQAYGYLFPMGPAFWLGKLAAVPPWIVQRTWESALLVAALLGMVRLAKLLRVPGFWPRVAAGLAYALAPRMLMEIGVISSELLPAAVLPWVLIPLVRGATAGSPRRAAAKSGLALLFAGGVNAAATVAILPVPALWLLTRSRGARRRALMLWWLLATACACLWWAIPLLVLGRYSPPFLDWIESSQVTTSPTSLIAVLRGADHWQAYLGPSEWPGGWILVAAPAAIVATTAVAALGLAGIARSTTPHRVFLVSCVVVGLALVTLGHVASVGPPFAGSVRDLLDGPLNAFRNVHKFDPVLRLPIAIGVGHAIGALVAWWPGRIRFAATSGHGRTMLVTALVGVAAVAIAPALSGRLIPGTRTSNDPSWWAQTGDWLGTHAGRALVVPGAAQPVYLWGAPRDDALQPYADGPWTVRNDLQLAQPGYVRLLNAVETALASGTAQPTLAPVLGRAGIRYLVVRNDLDTARSRTTSLAFVHATIAASPGFQRVASFGPGRAGVSDPNRLIDLGLTTPRAAVDIYENTAWHNEVTVLPADRAVVANGSSDELGPLVSAGLAPTTPVIFGRVPAAFAGGGTLRSVVTDGIRRREFSFGAYSRYSATLTADQPFAAPRAAHDFLPADHGPLTTAEYFGIKGMRASSSASDATSFYYRGPGYSPWAALDGDSSTAWYSASPSGAVGQWFAVDLASPINLSSLELRFPSGELAYPTRLRVTTAAGSVLTNVAPNPTPQRLRVPAGSTRFIRLAVVSVTDDKPGTQFAISALDIPGLSTSRTFNVPSRGTPDAFVFAVDAGRRSPCLSVASVATCDSSWALRGEEDDLLSRQFSTATTASYDVRTRVRFLPGANTDALLDAGNPIRAIASSVDDDDPRERPGAAVDGDASTGWVAGPNDETPSLTLTLPHPRAIDGMRLTPAAGAPVTRPRRVLIHASNVTFSAPVSSSGDVEFPHPVRTTSVVITVIKGTLRVSTDSMTGKTHLLPVGIGEVVLQGSHVPAATGARTVSLGCTAGLSLYLDDVAIPLQVTAPAADVLAGQPVTALPCGGSARLGAGPHLLWLGSDQRTAPESVTLTKAGVTDLLAGAPSAGTASLGHWAATSRTVRVSTTRPAFLVVRENANVGWRATLHGHALPSVTLDGWEQGWLLPSGADGVVELTFVPQRTADWGLIAGALALLLVILGALVAGRPGPGATLRDGRAGRRVLIAGYGIGLLLIGGVTGVAIAFVVGAALAVARRVAGPVPAWAVAVPVALAGVCEAWAPAGSAHPLADSAGVQLLCLLGVGLLLAAPAATAPRLGEALQQWPLEQVPGRRRGGGGGQRTEDEQLEEVPAERAPAEPALDRDE